MSKLPKANKATVDSPRPHGTYSIYIVKVLGGAHNEVYVGQTWHDPEVRRDQHRMGLRRARIFKRRGADSVGPLLPELLPPLEPLRTKAAALAAEAYVAAILRSKQFRVHGGH